MIKKSRIPSIKNCNIHSTSKVESGSNVCNSNIGKYSFCGYDCEISTVSIGSFCSIANNVIIGGGMHPMSWVSTSPVFYEGRDSIPKKFFAHSREEVKKTIIGHDVWIGRNVLVKQGVNIGTGSVVGMGSVVTKDVAPYTVVAGNPARFIRYRFDEKTINELLVSKWWELDESALEKLAIDICSPSMFLRKIRMKKKILIGYNYILHYRKSFFNELSNYYDVTVLHSGELSVGDSDRFSEIRVLSYKLGPFYLQNKLLNEIFKKKYDFVVLLFDVRWIFTVFAILLNKVFKKNKKIILWGAWITGSSIANKLRMFLSKLVYSNIFYTASARRDFVTRGLSSHNLFVANNTVKVQGESKSYEHGNKFRLLFVGSLDSRKKNVELITTFGSILKLIPNNIILSIIGDGDESQVLKSLVFNLGIEQRVEFIGRVESTSDLAQYYNEALVSVSYGQAGLSVLQSFGFGVPFLTHKNAISGGEKSNIKNGINGILCQDSKGLGDEMVRLANDDQLARMMGENAYMYYSEYCTVENMVQGFMDSMENTKLSHIDES